MRAFNVRVAIVEPGVIATPIFTKGAPFPSGSPYPHARRIMALSPPGSPIPSSPRWSATSFENIVTGDSWQLRYPAGPDAAPVLKGRASKTDEQVIEEAAQKRQRIHRAGQA
jgi:hypothetical protein